MPELDSCPFLAKFAKILELDNCPFLIKLQKTSMPALAYAIQAIVSVGLRLLTLALASIEANSGVFFRYKYPKQASERITLVFEALVAK